MEFFTRYKPAPSKPTVIEGPSMTFQEFKAECDINEIVKKPNLGINPLQPGTQKPTFGDFSSIELQDFQTAQNLLAEATQKFEMLSSDIRERFSNNPAKLIEFCNNPDNIEEGIKLGLYEKKEEIQEVTSKPSAEATSAVSEVGPQ